MAKDRWNAELTEVVRRLHYTDWRQKGREWEGTFEGVMRAAGRSLGVEKTEMKEVAEAVGERGREGTAGTPSGMMKVTGAEGK